MRKRNAFPGWFPAVKMTPPRPPVLEVPSVPPPSSRFVLPPPPSALLDRLQAFLPQMKKANELLEQTQAAHPTPHEEGVTLEEFSESDSDSEDQHSSEENNSSEEDLVQPAKGDETTGKGRNEMLLDRTEEEETGETTNVQQGLAALLDITSTRPQRPLKHSAGLAKVPTAEEKEVEAARARVGAGIVEME